MRVSGRARSAGRAAARSEAVEAAGRGGLVARGVIYLLVGLLAVRIAFGGTSAQADRSGAVEQIAERPFGGALLWLLGFGLAGMALWRLAQATWREPGKKRTARLAAAARSVFYGTVAYSVLGFAAHRGDQGGSGAGGSSDHQSKDLTARVLDLPLGPWLVAAGGGALIVAGGWIGVRAALRKDRKKLRTGRMSRATRRAVLALGVVGGISRGAVFATAGAFAVRAAVTYDADRARGLDDTLRAFRGTPAGPWLLALVGAGLVTFGLYSFAMARWRSD
ncbi:DUF1206 domain-containing protein [Streptomyces sp. NPDC018031]|uniref:DUF1206 domain-containing protein n=1 Tax=Streptomyces sp. NPDC018031 TaxID=3365033 RepID=UPI0037B85360